eukprot:GHVL01022776.1.p2 GENE.GHVL01022776.1~~GHVL01022776.1.p2  ORF type:complete len:431 (+),score=53.86 GHVL01022776.1:922-2214(+)
MFFREHNRLANRIKKYRPQWNHNQIFSVARALNIAQYQNIALFEYSSEVLGTEYWMNLNMESYQGYNNNIDPSIPIEWSQGVFRATHSMISDKLLYIDSDWGRVVEADLMKYFFNPREIFSRARKIDGFLVGLAHQPVLKPTLRYSQHIMTIPLGTPHLHLLALDCLRGRDAYVGSYGELRESLGMGRVVNVQDITSDPNEIIFLNWLISSSNKNTTAEALNDLPLFVGAALEKWNLEQWNDEVNNVKYEVGSGGSVQNAGNIDDGSLPFFGPTFSKMFENVIFKTRHGDRFWFENLFGDEYITSVNEGVKIDREPTIWPSFRRWRKKNSDNIIFNPLKSKLQNHQGNNENPLLNRLRRVTLAEIILRNGEKLDCLSSNQFRLPNKSDKLCMSALTDDIVDAAMELEDDNGNNTGIGLELIYARIMNERA